MSKFVLLRRGVALGLIVASVALQAHHSVAMFDLTQEAKVRGVVREFQWTNPHVWLQVMVTDSNGVAAEHGFEVGTPNTMVRDGWRKNSFKPGDKVTVYYGPRRDGTAGGQLLAALTPDGQWLHFEREKKVREE